MKLISQWELTLREETHALDTFTQFSQRGLAIGQGIANRFDDQRRTLCDSRNERASTGFNTPPMKIASVICAIPSEYQ